MYNVLSRIEVFTDINIFSDNPPALLYKSGDSGNHLWLGSSYFFIDKVMNLAGDKPDTKSNFSVAGGLLTNLDELDLFNPFPASRVEIENSKFFINIMNWAIKSCGKSIK